MVLCGGNDAVLSALSGGITEPGDINNVCGTCDITFVCVDRPIGSPNYNIRCHAIPGRWVTFFVLNTGGKALEWFHSVFCRDMTEQQFYDAYIPETLRSFFDAPDRDRREESLPVYVPFLGGSRYSMEQLKASFTGVTLETTRQDLLLSLIRGNALYHGGHLKEVAAQGQTGPQGHHHRRRRQNSRVHRCKEALDRRFRLRISRRIFARRRRHARPVLPGRALPRARRGSGGFLRAPRLVSRWRRPPGVRCVH